MVTRLKVDGANHLKLAKLHAYRSNWPWESMQGAGPCLKWGFRDLAHLDTVLPMVKQKRVAVQAGGNLGLFPKRLAEEFSTVYTFEPDPGLFAALSHNAPERNIVRIQAALGCEHDPVAVRCSRRDDKKSAVHEGLTHIAGPGTIPQVLIDELGLKACDLIYLDIEGYELNALIGAAETVEQFKPVIVVEINLSITFYGQTGEDLRTWILAMGYRHVLTINSDEVFLPC